MRAGFLIPLALTFWAGCQSPSKATRLPREAERPPFYNASNIAEYYARCPKCDSWTKGQLVQALYATSNGKRHCESIYSTDCPNCRAHFRFDEPLVNDARIVTAQKKR